MSEGVRRIVLAGGGTAGHVNPLLAVAAAMRRIDPDAGISVIGTDVGLERELVPQAGFELDTVAKVPFPRRPDKAALMFPVKWIRETRKVREILAYRQAQVVAGFGGYAAAPAYAVAHRMGVAIAIHEQNARAGMANKLGGRWADYVATVYEGTGLSTRRGVSVERIGLPLRQEIAELCGHLRGDKGDTRFAAAQRLGLDPNRPLIVVTGGSLGAVSVNRAVATCADLLLAGGAQIVHLTGRGKSDEVRRLVAAAAGDAVLNDLDPKHAGEGDYHVAQYLERIDLAFACADLVICRSGAGSVAELSALGLPAIYVPLPFGNGEQRFNAQPVVDAGGALMVRDAEFTSQWVGNHVPGLLADPSKLSEIRDKAWRYGIRDAAEVMAEQLLRMADARRGQAGAAHFEADSRVDDNG